MTDKRLAQSQKTQALMAAINGCSIAARVQTREPLTLDFVTRRITHGDTALALAAIAALLDVGVLVAEEIDGQRVYRLADADKEKDQCH